MNMPFYHALYLAIRENDKALREAKKSGYAFSQLTEDEVGYLDHFIDQLYSFYRFARGDAQSLVMSYSTEKDLAAKAYMPEKYTFKYNRNAYYDGLSQRGLELLTYYPRFIAILPKLQASEQYAFFGKFICNIDNDDIAAKNLLTNFNRSIRDICDEWHTAAGLRMLWQGHFDFGYGPQAEHARNNAQIGFMLQPSTRECVEPDTDKKYTKFSMLISYKFHPAAMNAVHDEQLAEMTIECNASIHSGMSIQDFFAETRIELNKLRKNLESNQKILPKFHNSLNKWSDQMLMDRFRTTIKGAFSREEISKLTEACPQLQKLL